MRRLDCHDFIKQLTSNYRTALRTVTTLIRLAEERPEYLRNYNLDLIEMRAVAAQLHDLYFSRIFAHFESCLRHYWRADVRDTKPMTEQLISSIAARRGVPQDTLDIVQEIRDFRNFLIHEEHEPRMRYTIDESIKHLNTYIFRLPIEW
jgi:hypothetical protein